jgi:hypothetical protein
MRLHDVPRRKPDRCLRAIFLTAFAVCALAVPVLASAASQSPYASVPSVGDTVRFDGSAGGASQAWAYPSQSLLESFLRGTIDASFGNTSYDEYQRKMSAVLESSLEFQNGASAVVQRVQAFEYRGHQDVEVEARITTGPFHALVWTTPAELVSASGHRYLR